MPFLRPNRYFAGLASINIERDLVQQGYTAVLLDLDNTVRSRETDAVPDQVKDWLDRARQAGIKLCILSNSWHGSAVRHARQLNIPVVTKSCKPLAHGYFMACRKLGVRPKNAVMVGDQILTDVLGARFARMGAYLVQPLSNVNIKSALWQRKVEQVILRGVPVED